MSMKIAITVAREASPLAPFVLRGPFTEAIREAAVIGYDAVELHLPDPGEINAGEILSVCRETNLRISSIGTGLAFLRDGITLTHSVESKRLEAKARMERFIDLGSQLKCVVIIGLMKGQVRDVQSRDQYLKLFEDTLRSLLILAEEREVMIVLEAVNRYESDIFNTIAETCTFIRQLESSKLKLHIDTFHMKMEEARPGDSIRAAGKLIGHVHIADSNRRFPGQGHYDFSETIAALKDIGYEGALSVECLGLPTPREAAQGACHYLRKAL